MSDLTQQAFDRLRREHGIISVQQLRESGVGKQTLNRLSATGVLIRVHKGVYRIASAPSTLEHRCVALSLAHPAGFVTGPTAGSMLGLRRMPASTAIHYCCPHGLRLERTAGVRWRQSRAIIPADVQRRPDGIRIAAWTRLAFDLAGDLPAVDHRSVVEQLLHENRFDAEQLAAIARRLVHPARPGSRRFVETLWSRSGPALESHPEVVLATALHDRDIPVVAQTSWLELPNGRRARIDLSVPELRWGIEIDVHPEHLGLDGTTSDKQRDRQCHLIGWEIERVTSVDLCDLDTLVNELASLYHARRMAQAS